MEISAILIAVGLSLFIIPFMFIFQRIFQTNSNKKKNNLPINWPVLGMLPSMLANFHRIHEFITDLTLNSNGTFVFQGPWFTTLGYLFTSDPTNINYILSKNSENFPKGSDFKKIFDDLGDGIFNADGASWHLQRRTALPVIKSESYENFVASVTWDKSIACLIPILKVVSETERMEIDMQDLFNRLAFDCTGLLVFGHDPNTLRVELPFSPEIQAFGDGLEAVLRRHVLPETIWRTLKWLNIGKEKKLAKASEVLSPFVYGCISMKRQKLKEMDGRNDDLDLLTHYMRIFPEGTDLFFRDTTANFIFAGKDTISSSLTWFFYLMAKYPDEQKKIREEAFANSKGGEWAFSSLQEVKNFFYLHAALCETLRLYPPVPLNHKAPVQPDILPSGHEVTKNTRTVLSFYSMGRMESIWGKDCLEFKPERWIAENGKGIKIVPSYKFTAFNSGSRSCIGKDMSFIQLKIVAAATLSRFQIQLVDGLSLQPEASIILHLKHGLKVKVSKYAE